MDTELGDGEMYDICLVVPPFGLIRRPPLGVAVLAATCRARGLKVKVLQASLQFAATIGADDYEALASSPLRNMVGELLFQPHAYPPETINRLSAWGDLVAEEPHLELLERHGDKVLPFLDSIVRQVLATGAPIVGLTSSMQQNMATSAIAMRVKQARPDACLVLGGANAFDDMAAGLARAFPWFDHIFTGEADVVFPDFCEALVRHGQRPESRIVHCEPIKDMRVVHAPDFTDYFAELRPLQAAGLIPADLPDALDVESSRGCWWGQKNHCTFCGLNAQGMDFRDKASGPFQSELRALNSRWGINRFSATDNIMPRKFLDDFLPEVATWADRPSLFYEVKANLKAEQLDLMRRAGIYAVQPGIESLSSPVLRLMNKGASGHLNIRLLRDCRAFGIDVVWGVLYGFPGETMTYYEDMMAVLPKLEHMRAPRYVSRIMIERFSPYFNRPQDYGIKGITPYAIYGALYPQEADLHSIAYHFDGDYTTEVLSSPPFVERLLKAITVWQSQWCEGSKPPTLHLIRRDQGAVVVDSRRIAKAAITPLSPDQLAVLEALDQPRTRSELPGDVVEWLLERDFIIDYEGLLASIVTTPDVVVTRHS